MDAALTLPISRKRPLSLDPISRSSSLPASPRSTRRMTPFYLLESSKLYELIKKLDLPALSSYLQNNQNHVYYTDSVGFTPLMHLVCSLESCEHVVEGCRLLIENGADLNAQDVDGFSVCHWAAASGHLAVLEFILDCKGVAPCLTSAEGDTPLHRACRLGRSEHVRCLLMRVPESRNKVNAEMQTPLQVAGMWLGRLSPESRHRVRGVFAETCADCSRTIVFTHDDCLAHIPRTDGSQGEQPWEHPDRLIAIMNGIRRSPALRQDPLLSISSDFSCASDDQILRCHSKKYLDFLYSLEASIDEESSVPVPFTPAVQRSIGQLPIERTKSCSLSDTSYSAGTLKAAKRACGAVVHACNQVLSGRARSAFCVVRPPGHHVGFNGPLIGTCSGSCGFSILNSIMVAAADIIQTNPKTRVAVVDLDIHHGNGSEDIAALLGMPDRLMFVSLHLFDSVFYPSTGDTSDLVNNIHNITVKPLWEDTSGGRAKWLSAVTDKILPLVSAFRPEIILLSSGFDGGSGDVGNCRHKAGAPSELGMDLTPADYAAATDAICGIANVVCGGRVVSVLEGGYGKMQWMETAPSRGRIGSHGSEGSASTAASDNAESSPDGRRGGRKRVKFMAPIFTQVLNRQSLAQSAASHLKAFLGLIQPHSL